MRSFLFISQVQVTLFEKVENFNYTLSINTDSKIICWKYKFQLTLLKLIYSIQKRITYKKSVANIFQKPRKYECTTFIVVYVFNNK